MVAHQACVRRNACCSSQQRGSVQFLGATPNRIVYADLNDALRVLCLVISIRKLWPLVHSRCLLGLHRISHFQSCRILWDESMLRLIHRLPPKRRGRIPVFSQCHQIRIVFEVDHLDSASKHPTLLRVSVDFRGPHLWLSVRIANLLIP